MPACMLSFLYTHTPPMNSVTHIGGGASHLKDQSREKSLSDMPTGHMMEMIPPRLFPSNSVRLTQMGLGWQRHPGEGSAA